MHAAAEALAAGRPGFAAQFAEAALAAAPDDVTALHMLVAAHRAAGSLAQAEDAARRCLALNPADLWACIELSHTLVDLGRLAEAEQHARHAVRAAPRAAAAHHALGVVLTQRQRPVPGEYHYRRVLALGGQRDPAVLANLAWNLKTQGRMEDSRATFRMAVTVDPRQLQAWLGWARLEEAERDFAAAEQKLATAERLAPGDPAVARARASILAHTGRAAEALAILERLAPFSRAALLEKGGLLDQMGAYDDAWAAWVEAQRQTREATGEVYQDAAAAALINALMAFFTPACLDALPRAGTRPEAPVPVFILGFPRSGAAVLEQMLTRHAGIAAGDDLPLVEELAWVAPRMLGCPLPYPAALAELFMGDRRDSLDHLRDYYLQKAASLGLGLGVGRGAARRFTDTTPLNETHLALIALVFPQAPLIHIQRHPLDVMVSLMANPVARGFCCGSDLRSAATHYARIDTLLRHYQAVLACKLLCLRYEDLVADPEKSLRRACTHVGEVFDPACLHTEGGGRYVRTARNAQARGTLHRGSLFRYKNYDRHLGPAAEILAPVIARLGYAI